VQLAEREAVCVSAAQKLLDRLPRVKQLRPGDFISGCPAHGSRQGRPVHITALDDGRVLLHPFCGCEVGDVLKAVGLTLADLFETPRGDFQASRSGVPARDLLLVLDHEITVAAIILADVLKERTVDESQWKRLAEAAGRIGRAREHGRA
jgi:hypothetical protein